MYGTSGYALTQKECSDKYNAAKAGGTLNGQTWNAFRKAECASEAATPVGGEGDREEGRNQGNREEKR